MADDPFETGRGKGGETHQHVPEGGPHDAAEAHLTTNQGIRVPDNQNSLKSGATGPTLLEDFVLREKIFILITSAFRSGSSMREAQQRMVISRRPMFMRVVKQ